MATEKNIPFFQYNALVKEHEGPVRKRVEEVLDRGAFILQKEVDELEASLREFIGVKHAITCANGTDGLILALRALELEPGYEAIMPSHTYIATAASVHFTGGKIKLVECGEDHMVNVNEMEKAISDKTRVLMPVHINGRTCQMDRVMDMAKANGLHVVEDAAQALGSHFKGQHAGTFGIAGMFSFYPAKVLGCWGDGGLVVTNDDEMADKLYYLRDHGRNQKGEVVAWGLNSRLDNLQAAVLDEKLKHYKQNIQRRRQVAGLYHEGLKDVPGLRLPPPPQTNGDHFDVFQNYELEAENRDQLKTFLGDNGIGTMVQWGGKAVHMHEKLGFEGVRLPVTEAMTSRFLMLPMNMFISDEDVRYIIGKVREFYGV